MMRKITLMILTLGICTGAFAQSELKVQDGLTPQPEVKKDAAVRIEHRNDNDFNLISKAKKKEDFSGWFSFPVALANSGFGNFNGSLIRRYIHPDTLTQVFTNSTSTLPYVSVGQVFDPKSEIYAIDQNDATQTLSEYNAYRWDSLGVVWYYVRGVDTFNGQEVIDTLFVQYFNNNRIDRSLVWINVTGGDTTNIPFGMVSYNVDLMRSNIYTREDTILLGRDDTAIFNANVSSFEAGYDVPANGAVAATVTFKPGYPVTATDTLRYVENDEWIYKHNAVAVREFIDQNDYPEESYNNGLFLLDGQIYDRGSFQSPWLNRYFAGNSPGGSNFYIDLQFHISTTTLSTPDEASIENESNVYPNPASQASGINMKLDLANDKFVEIELYNMGGQLVETLHSGNMSRGIQRLNMPIDNLNAGMYVVKIQVGNEVKSQVINITR